MSVIKSQSAPQFPYLFSVLSSSRVLALKLCTALKFLGELFKTQIFGPQSLSFLFNKSGKGQDPI